MVPSVTQKEGLKPPRKNSRPPATPWLSTPCEKTSTWGQEPDAGASGWVPASVASPAQKLPKGPPAGGGEKTKRPPAAGNSSPPARGGRPPPRPRGGTPATQDAAPA